MLHLKKQDGWIFDETAINICPGSRAAHTLAKNDRLYINLLADVVRLQISATKNPHIQQISTFRSIQNLGQKSGPRAYFKVLVEILNIITSTNENHPTEICVTDYTKSETYRMGSEADSKYDGCDTFDNFAVILKAWGSNRTRADKALQVGMLLSIYPTTFSLDKQTNTLCGSLPDRFSEPFDRNIDTESRDYQEFLQRREKHLTGDGRRKIPGIKKGNGGYYVDFESMDNIQSQDPPYFPIRIDSRQPELTPKRPVRIDPAVESPQKRMRLSESVTSEVTHSQARGDGSSSTGNDRVVTHAQEGEAFEDFLILRDLKITRYMIGKWFWIKGRLIDWDASKQFLDPE